MTKKIIKVVVEDVSPYEFDTTLSSVKEKVDELIKEHGPDAHLDWDPDHWFPYDSSPSPRFRIRIDREETDEEYKARLEQERKIKEDQDERDRKEFERLKKKFEAK